KGFLRHHQDALGRGEGLRAICFLFAGGSWTLLATSLTFFRDVPYMQGCGPIERMGAQGRSVSAPIRVGEVIPGRPVDRAGGWFMDGLKTTKAQMTVSSGPLVYGSPGRIRTSDQPVNSRLLYR